MNRLRDARPAALALAALVAASARFAEVVCSAFYGGLMPVDPVAGVALAASLLGGPAMLACACLGALLAGASAGLTVAGNLTSTASAGLTALLGAALLVRAPSFSRDLARLSDVRAIAFRCALLATLPGAALSGIVEAALHSPRLQPLWALFMHQWIASALGVLLLAPPLLAWVAGEHAAPSRGRRYELLGLCIVTILVSSVLFLNTAVAAVWAAELIVLLFPLLAWIGLRFSVRGSSVALLLVAIIAVSAAPLGAGPFQPGVSHLGGLGLAVFLLAATLTTLALSGAHGELRDAMRARRASDDLLRAVFAQATVGLALLNSELRRIMVNRRLADMLGYSERELMSMPVGSIVPHDERESAAARLASVLAGNAPAYELERRYVRRDGTIVWATIAVSRVQDAGGDPAVLVVTHDVTDRHRAEAALRESEERFRAAFEQASIGMALRALDGRWLRVNAKLCSLLGYERDELLGLTSVDVTPPEDRALATQNNERMASGELTNVSREKRYQRKDGTIVWVHLSIGIVRGPDGRILHQLSVIQDITDRKRAEAALRESEEQLRAMFEQAHVGINVRAFDGRWIRVNRRMCEIAGRSEAEFMALPPIEPTHPDDAAPMQPMAAQMLRGELDGYTREKRYLHKDGTVVWANVSVSALRDKDGRPVHRFSIVEDITDRKRAEAAVRALNEELEARVAERTAALQASNRELEAFSHSVAHDLRAPLRAMDGYSRIVLDTYGERLNEEGRNYLLRIRSASQRMAELIDSLLQLSRISRSEMRLETIDLSTAAHDCVADLRAREPQRDLQIVIEPGLVRRGDRALLRLAMNNLLENAWKFTGRLALGARIEVASAGMHAGLPVFVVRDNGAGFDMSHADKLFGAFHRLHRGSEFPGTGIGLATVKRIVERHGGTIWAESEPNKGAAFYVALPG